jgi:hypothetical protein
MGQKRMTTPCPVKHGEGACPAGGYCWRRELCESEVMEFYTPDQFQGDWDTAAIALGFDPATEKGDRAR